MDARSFTLPDFRLLESKVLERCGRLQLLPGAISADSRYLEFFPGRNGKAIEFKRTKTRSPLPRMDLSRVGSGADRSIPSLVAEATEIIGKRTFTLMPNFNLCKIAALATRIPGVLEMQAMAMSLEWRFDRPSQEKLEGELWAPLAAIQEISFSILADEEVPGLDLSKPVAGFVLDIINFVLPEGWDEGCNKALPLAFLLGINIQKADLDLDQQESEYEEYIKNFHLFSKKGRMERSIAQTREALVFGVKKFDILMKCILDGTDQGVAPERPSSLKTRGRSKPRPAVGPARG